MEITYDELLAKIDDFIVFRGALKNDFVYALRAVVELHKPWKSYCSYCLNIEGGYMPYPCTEIQAIEKELG